MIKKKLGNKTFSHALSRMSQELESGKNQRKTEKIEETFASNAVQMKKKKNSMKKRKLNGKGFSF